MMAFCLIKTFLRNVEGKVKTKTSSNSTYFTFFHRKIEKKNEEIRSERMEHVPLLREKLFKVLFLCHKKCVMNLTADVFPVFLIPHALYLVCGSHFLYRFSF